MNNKLLECLRVLSNFLLVKFPVTLFGPRSSVFIDDLQKLSVGEIALQMSIYGNGNGQIVY